jgi:hypothetical protein
MNTAGSYVQAKPKKTRQGQGKNSKPSHRRKQLRGQGK